MISSMDGFRMECLVTGAAGFIGSQLCETLLQQGNHVHGIDCLTPYYPRAIKERNLDRLKSNPSFTFHELDLGRDPLTEVVESVDWVFHLAAMPGLVRSWTHFDEYHQHNIVATQRLFESLKDASQLQKVVYASTSSVYGRYASGDEGLPTKPSSPYGITKLAAENLGRVYHEEFGIPVVNLRYFSVYGPGQRPDMGYHRFIDAILKNEPISLFGDGQQVRGNTYVSDIVAATIAAADRAMAGDTFNVGGGELVTVRNVIQMLEKLTGRKAIVQMCPARAGDQRYTGADIRRITKMLGWEPTVSLEEGLNRQIAWQSESIRRAAA